MKAEIETALAEAKTAVEGGDADDDAAEDRCADPGGDEARPGDVQGSSRPQTEAAAGAGRGDVAARRASSRAEEEVVDAEFSEVDEARTRADDPARLPFAGSRAASCTA